MHRTTRTRRSLVSLGPDFNRLWAASAISNLGDGLTRAAVPLFVLTLSRDPAVVAATTLAQQLPWLLFPLVSGVYVDRLDRRRLAIAVNAARACLVAVLAGAIWIDLASLAVLFAVIFALATAETLADGVTVALVPTLLPPRMLARGNGRIASAQIVADQLAGPALGATLFAAATALPFALDALTFAAAALLLTGLRSPDPAQEDPSRGSIWVDIRFGIGFLWHESTLKLLGLLITVMNITFMVAFATWALYVREELGLGPVGFGVLLTVGASGGLVGSFVVAPATARFGPATVLRAGLVIEIATHTVLATNPVPVLAGVTMFIFGIHASASGVTGLTIRQHIIPNHLLGRVNSAYALLDRGGAAAGAALGALLVTRVGLTGVFWIAGTTMALLTIAVWHPLKALDRQAP